jgi:hypothetical protein
LQKLCRCTKSLSHTAALTNLYGELCGHVPPYTTAISTAMEGMLVEQRLPEGAAFEVPKKAKWQPPARARARVGTRGQTAAETAEILAKRAIRTAALQRTQEASTGAEHRHISVRNESPGAWQDDEEAIEDGSGVIEYLGSGGEVEAIEVAEEEEETPEPSGRPKRSGGRHKTYTTMARGNYSYSGIEGLDRESMRFDGGEESEYGRKAGGRKAGGRRKKAEKTRPRSSTGKSDGKPARKRGRRHKSIAPEDE